MYSIDYDKKSNQTTWGNFLNKKQEELSLEDLDIDKKSSIFLNHSFTCDNKFIFDNKEKRLIMEDKTKPCFIQGNGCEDLSKIIKNTGYSDYDIHNERRFLTVVQNNLKAVFFIYPIAAMYIFLLIVSAVFVGNFIYKYYQSRNDKYKYIYL